MQAAACGRSYTVVEVGDVDFEAVRELLSQTPEVTPRRTLLASQILFVRLRLWPRASPHLDAFVDFGNRLQEAT
jgi:hypothetical protein